MGNSTSIYDKIQEHKRIHWFTTETMSSTMFQPYGEAWKWLENIGKYLKMDSFLKLFSNFFFLFLRVQIEPFPNYFQNIFHLARAIQIHPTNIMNSQNFPKTINNFQIISKNPNLFWATMEPQLTISSSQCLKTILTSYYQQSQLFRKESLNFSPKIYHQSQKNTFKPIKQIQKCKKIHKKSELYQKHLKKRGCVLFVFL